MSYFLFDTFILALLNFLVISESDLDSTLREIRIALLEADVALVVVKDFISSVKENILARFLMRILKLKTYSAQYEFKSQNS